MASKRKEYRVYGRHPGNLPRCLNIFDTYERLERFAKAMVKRDWRDVNIFSPSMQPVAAPDGRPSVAV